MKRLGIFVFYDASGIVDEYVEYLLKSMQNIIKKLVIIINGEVKDVYYNKLKKYSQDIFIRKNYGYDAGAYKDVFTQFLPREEQVQWDEVVLFNDTFYGPLYPWEGIFDYMEAENIDFWGLARHPEGILEGYPITQHIQSYFLVCRKSLLESEWWIKFWQSLSHPVDITDAILSFEVNFSEYFSRAGFKSKALTDEWEVEYTGNPSLRYYFELIKYIKFPVIKRKVFSLINFMQNKLVINYIRCNTNYNVNMIFGHLKRLEEERRIELLEPFNYDELEKFYESHKRIFIYGCGKYGQCLAEYFKYKEWKFEGFIVTQRSEDMTNVYEYGKFFLDKWDGIILALGQKAINEVYPIIEKDLENVNFLLPKIRK